MTHPTLPKSRRKRAAKAGGVVRVALQSRAMLAASVMPAVRGGGLFVPTDTDYQLGDKLCLVVSLMDQPAVPVMGRVIWVTPEGAFGHRLRGAGLQLEDDDNGRRLNAAIAELLPAGSSKTLPHTF